MIQRSHSFILCKHRQPISLNVKMKSQGALPLSSRETLSAPRLLMLRRVLSSPAPWRSGSEVGYTLKSIPARVHDLLLLLLFSVSWLDLYARRVRNLLSFSLSSLEVLRIFSRCWDVFEKLIETVFRYHILS